MKEPLMSNKAIGYILAGTLVLTGLAHATHILQEQTKYQESADFQENFTQLATYCSTQYKIFSRIEMKKFSAEDSRYFVDQAKVCIGYKDSGIEKGYDVSTANESAELCANHYFDSEKKSITLPRNLAVECLVAFESIRRKLK